MNKEIYAILNELSKDAQERNPKRMNRLAELLTAEGPIEVKQMYNQWLEDHPEMEDALMRPSPDEPETMVLPANDRDLLKNLLGH
ncbi:hypothetical protein BVY04_05170 [bacterium M21]|nr:hypothetical protein BVY04_05170 [bacterium M21]